VSATIVLPEDASPAKREAAAADGARIVPCDAARREAVARDLAAREGLTLVPPFEHPRIVAGQGTAAWELFEQAGPLDLLLVPVGGGGLLAGSALAASVRSPRCRVVGVEPAAAADAGRSFREGRNVPLPGVPDTLADGLRTQRVGALNFEIIRERVADMAEVPEEAIAAAVRFALLRLKTVLEPSAAVPLAALLIGAVRAPGARIGMIATGGNADASMLARCLGTA
jgi:threonine dehydratase